MFAGGIPVGRGLDDPFAVAGVGIHRRRVLRQILEYMQPLVVDRRAAGLGAAQGKGQERKGVRVGPLTHPPLVMFLENIRAIAIEQVDVVVIPSQWTRRIGHVPSFDALLLDFHERFQCFPGLPAVIEVLVPPDDENSAGFVAACLGVRKGRFDPVFPCGFTRILSAGRTRQRLLLCDCRRSSHQPAEQRLDSTPP